MNANLNLATATPTELAANVARFYILTRRLSTIKKGSAAATYCNTCLKTAHSTPENQGYSPCCNDRIISKPEAVTTLTTDLSEANWEQLTEAAAARGIRLPDRENQAELDAALAGTFDTNFPQPEPEETVLPDLPLPTEEEVQPVLVQPATDPTPTVEVTNDPAPEPSTDTNLPVTVILADKSEKAFTNAKAARRWLRHQGLTVIDAKKDGQVWHFDA